MGATSPRENRAANHARAGADEGDFALGTVVLLAGALWLAPAGGARPGPRRRRADHQHAGHRRDRPARAPEFQPEGHRNAPGRPAAGADAGTPQTAPVRPRRDRLRCQIRRAPNRRARCAGDPLGRAIEAPRSPPDDAGRSGCCTTRRGLAADRDRALAIAPTTALRPRRRAAPHRWSPSAADHAAPFPALPLVAVDRGGARACRRRRLLLWRRRPREWRSPGPQFDLLVPAAPEPRPEPQPLRRAPAPPQSVSPPPRRPAGFGDCRLAPAARAGARLSAAALHGRRRSGRDRVRARAVQRRRRPGPRSARRGQPAQRRFDPRAGPRASFSPIPMASASGSPSSRR